MIKSNERIAGLSKHITKNVHKEDDLSNLYYKGTNTKRDLSRAGRQKRNDRIVSGNRRQLYSSAMSLNELSG